MFSSLIASKMNTIVSHGSILSHWNLGTILVFHSFHQKEAINNCEICFISPRNATYRENTKWDRWEGSVDKIICSLTWWFAFSPLKLHTWKRETTSLGHILTSSRYISAHPIPNQTCTSKQAKKKNHLTFTLLFRLTKNKNF